WRSSLGSAFRSPNLVAGVAICNARPRVPLGSSRRHNLRMHDALNLSAFELSVAYGKRQMSPAEVVRALFNRIEQLNPQVNALYACDFEAALAAARASERRWIRGSPLGVLDGVPVSIKDHLAVKGMPSTWGCVRDEEPAASDDTAVAARLRESGAVIFGKTTMCELGFYPGSINLPHGPCRQPWDPPQTARRSTG